MEVKEIIEAIRNSRNLGLSDENIRETLRNQRFAEDEIAKAFSFLPPREEPEMPVPPPVSVPPMPQFQPLQPMPLQALFVSVKRSLVMIVVSLWIIAIALLVMLVVIVNDFTPKKQDQMLRKVSLPKPTIVTPSMTQHATIALMNTRPMLCLGDSYAIVWKVPGKVTSASINLSHPADPVSVGVIATDLAFQYSEKEKVTTGAYDWSAGSLSGKAKPVPLAEGYVFELSVHTDNGDKYAISEPFVLQSADACVPSSTPEIPSSPSAMPLVTLPAKPVL